MKFKVIKYTLLYAYNGRGGEATIDTFQIKKYVENIIFYFESTFGTLNLIIALTSTTVYNTRLLTYP